MLNLYRGEISAGIENRQSDIVTTRAVARLVPPHHRSQAAVSDDAVAQYLTCVSATSGWSDTDDVLDRVELWQCRATYKPLQLGSGSRIIGSVVDVDAVDADGTLVDSTTVVENLPPTMKIRSTVVVWRIWEDKKVEEEVALALSGTVALQTDFRFTSFDYAILEPDGTVRVILRDKATAYLSQHLRAFGGSGELNGQRFGRVLRGLAVTSESLHFTPRESMASAVAKCVGLTTGVPARNESLAEQITRCFS